MLFLLFGVLHVVHSQTITIKDKETKKKLELVTLFSENPRVYASTNAKGQTDISAFQGAEKIEISTLGYKKEIKSYAELESASFEVLLEASILNLEEAVVSGTRWRQTTNDIPSKIISISSREVALHSPQTAADLLSISGKVFVQKSQQGGGSPMIRGFSTNRLLYVVDGVRMNTAIFRSGNIQNVINLDPLAIERTEVLFGPGSVIYGSDAIGGVMSFQTLTPQLSLTSKPLVTGKALFRTSSANSEKTGHFDISVGGENWAMVTSISANDFDHLRQGSNGPDDYLKPYFVQRIDGIDRVVTQKDPLLQIPSAYSQMNVMQKVRFKPNHIWDFQYGFHYSTTSFYGRYDRHNEVRNGSPRYAVWNYGPQKWMMNNLSVAHTGNNVAYDQMTLRLAQQSFEESRIDRSFNDSSLRTRTEKVEAYSVNLDFLKIAGSKNTLFYGFEYVLNDIASKGIAENIITGVTRPNATRYPQANWSSIAAYINDEFMASDKLTLQAGLRYNQFILDAEFDTAFYPFPFTTANINNGALTGSIGGVFNPSHKWVINANIGTAFRSPNVDDVGKVFDSEPGVVVIPNPELQAEYAYNFDLGIARVFEDVIKLDLTAYYTFLENALVRRDFRLNGQDSIKYDGVMSKVQAIQNAAVANVYGIQAGLEVKLPGGLGFTSDLNYQLGQEELDDGAISPSRHAAPLFGVSRLMYHVNQLNLHFYAMYQGERSHDELPVSERGKDEIYALDSNGNTYTPAWYTLNLKVMYQFSDALAVSTGIENLTDLRYRPYSSGISAPGRNFIISLQGFF